MLHPEVAYRDCGDCKRHVYDDKGKRAMRRGKPVVRPRGMSPPCHSCPKVAPTGSPGCVELSEKNWQAYRHYKECQAVGRFPDDATVRRNAAVIRMAEESADQARQAGALTPLLKMLEGGHGHGR